MPLSRLLYFSRAQIDMSDMTEVSAIVRHAARKNSARSITGVLATSDDAFIQLLEGCRTALSELLGQLYRDPRHKDICVVDFRAIDERVTGAWAMATPSLESRFAYEPLSYERLGALKSDDLLRRMSRYETNPILAIESQLERPASAVFL